MNFLRHQNLVYLSIPKHASTFYQDIFLNHLGWKKIDLQDIDWDKDKVFAHIINPMVRHTKGTIQALMQLNLIKYVDHPLLQELLPNAIFDYHSQPLVTTIGRDICYKIEWIPLDHPEFSGNQLTTIFLRDHGVSIDLNAFPMINISDKFKKDLFNKISKLKSDNLSIQNWYEQDISLYESVLNSGRPTNWNSWHDLSWLERR